MGASQASQQSIQVIEDSQDTDNKISDFETLE